MAKGQSAVTPKSNKKYVADTTPGKVRKGKMVDGKMVYDDEVAEAEDEEESDEEDEDEEDDDTEGSDEDDDSDDEEPEDEEPAPKLTKRERAAAEMRASIDAKKHKAAPPKTEAQKPKKITVEPDQPTQKLSQRTPLPAEQRKVANETIKKGQTAVTVKDLCTEFDQDDGGKRIRRIIRALDYKAPSTNSEPGTFAAKAKYEWAPDSKVLIKIRAAIEADLEE